MLRFPAGYAEPCYFHTTAGHAIYVLEGRISFAGIEAAEGHFFYTPPYTVHDLVALGPSEILIWSDGPLDFHLSDADGVKCTIERLPELGAARSRLSAAAGMRR